MRSDRLTLATTALLLTASLFAVPACGESSDSPSPIEVPDPGAAGGAGMPGVDETPAEPLYGDVAEGEPCKAFRDCQEGLTCNSEGARSVCRDPLLERPYCYSDLALGGNDPNGCFCSTSTGVSTQLQYGCAGTFEKSGDLLCCADAAWPESDLCVCRTYRWVCGGDADDCFCTWTFGGDDGLYTLPPAMCRQRSGQHCCNNGSFCACNDYHECNANETEVPSCGTAMGAPTCSDDETTVTECKPGPQPPRSLPMPDPEPPKPSTPSAPCDPETCNGSMGSCDGGFCYFCSWSCRASGCESTCTD